MVGFNARELLLSRLSQVIVIVVAAETLEQPVVVLVTLTVYLPAVVAV